MKFPLPKEFTSNSPLHQPTPTAGGVAIAALAVAIVAAAFALAALTLSIVNAVRISRLRLTVLENTHQSRTESQYCDENRSMTLSSEGKEKRLKEEWQTCPSCDKLRRIAVIMNSDDPINCNVIKDKKF